MAAGLNTPASHLLFSSTDVPAYFAARNLTRFVRTRTTVAPDGTVQNCVAELSAGDAYLDAYTCKIIKDRAKFVPAKWVDGSPVYGVLRADIIWGIYSDIDPNPFPPDMYISVNRLPKGARKRVTVNLMIAVDETGRLRGCGQAPSVWKHEKTFPELVPLACEQFMNEYVVPVKDSEGKAVRSVQSASVAFSPGK